ASEETGPTAMRAFQPLKNSTLIVRLTAASSFERPTPRWVRKNISTAPSEVIDWHSNPSTPSVFFITSAPTTSSRLVCGADERLTSDCLDFSAIISDACRSRHKLSVNTLFSALRARFVFILCPLG
ncbi:hypothetical protein FRC12_002225, partial [Ceratobasidium sp. 428]